MSRAECMHAREFVGFGTPSEYRPAATGFLAAQNGPFGAGRSEDRSVANGVPNGGSVSFLPTLSVTDASPGTG